MKKHGILFITLFLMLFFQGRLSGNATFMFSDFNDGKADRNSLGFVASSFQNNGALCDFTAEKDYNNVYGQYGCSLRLDYDVRTPDSYCGYWSKIHGQDLSAYKYLSFYVKGATGNEYFKVQLKVLGGDVNSGKSDVFVDDFIDGGLSQDWRKVVIPLDAFVNIKDWTQVDELVFVFENYQSSMNGSVLKSSVFIDNIVFGTRSLGFLTVDNFSDLFPPLPVGGNTGTGGDKGTVSSSIVKDPYDQFPNSLRLDYNVNTGTSYAYYFMVLGGGDDGWTKLDHDLSSYTKYSFNVKAEKSPGKNPCGLKVEIHDYSGNGTGEPFYIITNSSSKHITTNWQNFKFNLSDFKDFDSVVLDKKKVQELAFTFENGNASNKIGTVYIDTIQFEAAGFTNKSAIPSAPYGLSDNGTPLSDNFTLNNNSKLIVSAGSSSSDPLLECVRFEFSSDNVNWHAFKIDFDLSDTVYEAKIAPDSFSAKDAYYLRVVAENIWGHTAVLGPYQSIKVSKNGYSEERSGKLICIFSVENNPFSPNGDGIMDTVKFNYTLSVAAEVSFRVFDMAGNIVYKKDDGSKSAGVGQTIEWNGRDVNNAVVKNGVYYYRISAKGSDGSEDKIIQIIGVIK